MNRVYVKYDVLSDILQVLPAGRQLHVVDEYVKIIEIDLDHSECEDLRARGIEIGAKSTRKPQPLVDFDQPGEDSRFKNANFPGLINFNNPWSRVYRAGSVGGYRIDYYNPYHGGEDFSVELRYDGNFETMHIVGGKMIQPAHYHLGIRRMHQKGYTGAGVKICCIDIAYSGDIPHQDLDIPKSRIMNPNLGDDPHSFSMLSILGAKKEGDAGVVGIAPDADLYFADANNVGASLSWGAQQGCKIFTLAFQSYPDLYFKEAVQKITADGGAVLISAGNGVSGNFLLQPLCTVRDTVACGGLIGGLSVIFEPRFRYTNILETEGQKLQFAMPAMWVGATSFGYDVYRGEGGTSPAQTSLGGMLALLSQKFPGQRMDMLLTMLKRKCGTITDRGITVCAPHLHFVR